MNTLARRIVPAYYEDAPSDERDWDEVAPLPEYEGLRSLLPEGYEDTPDAVVGRTLDRLLMDMTPIEADFFTQALRTLAPIAQVALPVAGSLLGGPAGGALGAAGASILGQLAGNQSVGAAAAAPPWRLRLCRHAPVC